MGSVHAIIPARGGSKGVRRKNLRRIGGISLLERAIQSAQQCEQIDGCFVSTDDAEIAEVGRRCGARVIDRPLELAADSSLMSDAVAHALEKMAELGEMPEYFVLLQPTSPLRKASHVSECLMRFFSSGCACAISVCEMEHHPYKAFICEQGQLRPLRDRSSLELPRQELPSILRQNGAIYVLKAESFLAERIFYMEPAMPYLMSRQESVDVDDESDLALAELHAEVDSREMPPWMAFGDAPRKFGKPIDMKRLKRNLGWRRETAEEQRAVAERYAHTKLPPVAACPVCGGGQNRPFVTVYGTEFLECGSCGNLYMKTPPDPEAVARLYVGAEDEKCIQDKIYIDEEIFQQRVCDIAEPKVEFVRELLDPGGTWIDIGCGTGELLTAAGKRGWRAVGVEPDPASARFARAHGIEVHEGYLPSSGLNYLFEDASVVSMINVLEHVSDPLGLLREVASLVPSGAAVVFEVPRHPSLSSYINYLFPELAYRHIYPPDHLNIFTEQSVEGMLRDCGLTASGIWVFGQDMQDLLSVATIAAQKEETPLLGQLIEATPDLQKVLDRQGLADVLFVVAIKF